jgi:hypothetical protein
MPVFWSNLLSRNKRWPHAVSAAVLLLSVIAVERTARGASSEQAPVKQAEKPLNAPSDEQMQVKSFNEVLQDLVNEFSFDLRAKALSTVRTVSVRRVALGEGIPRTYESYLETQISDAFRKHSGTKVLQCTNCRVRRTVVENGRLVMTTPINNPQELDAIASQLGVEAWVDVTLIYQETSMILGFHVFDSKTKELLWTKLYNTENIYKEKMIQKEEENKKTKDIENTKVSKYSVSTTLGWQLVPNVKQSANMIAVNFKFAEKFNLGRDEVGTRLGGILAPSVVISDYPEISGDPSSSAEVVDGKSKEVILPFTKALALSAIYGHLFGEEAIHADAPVWGVEFGAGTIVSTGYACISLRSGLTLRLGQRFVFDAGVSYSLPTTISIKSRYKYTTPGGLGADAAFGLHF